jgi:hypothetical protein
MPQPRKTSCPACKERPKHRYPSGKLASYCSPCAVIKARERKGHAPAERACESCGKPYRGNSRAKFQRCPACRAVCAECGASKSPGDIRHTLCQACRSRGKICDSCRVNPTFQNRRECWDCLAADGTYTAQARDRIYSLPPGWYDQKLAEQGGVCEISGLPETSVSKRTGKTYPLAVDHDRSCCPGPSSCGKCLRGLIRRNLNVALGMFGDDPELLRAAANYIERHRQAAAIASAAGNRAR